MKRLSAALLTLIMLVSLTACAGVNTPAPSPEPTEAEAAPTEAPTPAPTEAPTAEPTTAPYYEPYEVRLGKLTDGPMLPDEEGYLVIKGESDLFYVYNGKGALEYAFNAVADENEYCFVGIYGSKGVCCGVQLATGERVGDPEYVGDIIFTWEGSWDEETDEYVRSVKTVYNADFEPMCSFDKGELEMGEFGGILHIDGMILQLNRDIDWESNSMYYVTEPALYSENGEFIRNIDLTTFGTVCGVLGGKYLVTVSDEDWDSDPFERRYCIYTLDGELIMERAQIKSDNGYYPDGEMWMCALHGADYVIDKNGDLYDSELQPVDEIPEDIGFYSMAEPYRLIYDDDFVYNAGNVYAGVKDAEGNWLFRIYNPRGASDSGNPGGDW